MTPSKKKEPAAPREPKPAPTPAPAGVKFSDWAAI